MVLFARSAVRFGSVLLIAGVIWAVAILKGGADVWPSVLDRPFAASAVAVLGVVLIRLAHRAAPGKPLQDRVVANHAGRLSPDDFDDMMPPASAARRSDRPRDDGPSAGAQDALPVAGPKHGPHPESDTPEEPGAMGPVAIARAVFERLQQEARRPAAMAGGRTAFHVAVPTGGGDSWIGGRPRMPEHWAWPDVAGAPALFLAQIALDELEPEIWAGLGPKDGWLLLFCAANPRDGVVVLHSTETGRTRRSPPDAPPAFGRKSAEARLADLIGPEAMVPPRWSLEPRAATANGGDTGQPGRARSGFLADAVLNDPVFYPFDWVSAFCLLDSVDVALRRELKSWERERAAALSPDKAEAARNARLTVLARLRLLTRQTEASAELGAFDEDEADDLLSALAELTTQGWADSGRADSILSLGLFRGYKALLETRARHLCAADPDQLPKALRRTLMPVWQQEAERPALKIGGARDVDTVVLATLFPDTMSGLAHALNRPLRILLPRQALETGDFGAAYLDTANAPAGDPPSRLSA